jgi:hypothetical protein
MIPFGWSYGESPDLPAVFQIGNAHVPTFGFRTRKDPPDDLRDLDIAGLLQFAEEHLFPEGTEAFTWLIRNKKDEITIHPSVDLIIVEMDKNNRDAALFKLFWL